ncbi:23S rRNA (pseudouridine(1915)-N(3))-methyltransferase RlmH [Gilvibacter sediminis]|uniref:23S rRNA (pseudouridine(1915)-N(3))-methyltransferase RlmH n=1 Tax=Gilvibacter sediminis TaxID=379071 RepID=UPI002350628E|nr:23S rRNA (pseudouridine(1915)-N(3))-methyltransferase RlmH [Gilvibacter sediminis]MDC7998159.1 23S rRNA (pseudouridine(1915)-N(3))-methyltransferase RlmH [Gilvibacter sediminis]
MQITLLAVGKTDSKEIEQLTEIYTKRVSRYVRFELKIIPDLKKRAKLSFDQQKKLEADLILAQLNTSDFVVLLDENGKQYNSVDFSQFLQQRMNSGIKNLVFIIGGPYGFDQALYSRANSKLSLSKMTFSHQMVRLFFAEQLYRGFSILNNEPYHHQ